MDILEQLKAAQHSYPDYPLSGMLGRAIDEITRLRSLAGAVTRGPTAREVLGTLRGHDPNIRQNLRDQGYDLVDGVVTPLIQQPQVGAGDQGVD